MEMNRDCERSYNIREEARQGVEKAFGIEMVPPEPGGLESMSLKFFGESGERQYVQVCQFKERCVLTWALQSRFALPHVLQTSAIAFDLKHDAFAGGVEEMLSAKYETSCDSYHVWVPIADAREMWNKGNIQEEAFWHLVVGECERISADWIVQSLKTNPSFLSMHRAL